MIVSFLLFVYLVLLIVIVVKWNTFPQPINSVIISQISIVIPFRNEEDKLGKTIQCLLSQNTNLSLDIILINDHSTDSSLQIANEFRINNPSISVLSLSDTSGKKAALLAGIQQSKSEWILQSDADCQMKNNWVNTMVSGINDGTKLLLGPVIATEKNKKWDWFNQIESMILQTITAVSAYFNQALLSNGANLLYKKSDYLEYTNSGLGQDFASGDDYFLMQFIQQKYLGGIQYLKNVDAIIETDFPNNWEKMIHQRSRWAKKSTGEKGLNSVIMIFLIGIHFIFPLLLISSIFSPSILNDAIPFFVTKTIMELILIYYADQFFKTKKYNHILLFAILYPIFLFQIVLSFRDKNNTWKDRSI